MKTINLVSVLDSSGSMMSVADRVRGTYNAFLSRHKELSDNTNFEFVVTTYLFNSVVRVLDSRVPIKSAQLLTPQNYTPSGGTALYDAVGKALYDFGPKEDVLLYIDTDGYENSSINFNHGTLTKLISERTAVGWDISFIGADLSVADVSTMANDIGIAKFFAFDKTSSGYKARAGVVSANTATYLSTKGT